MELSGETPNELSASATLPAVDRQCQYFSILNLSSIRVVRRWEIHPVMKLTSSVIRRQNVACHPAAFSGTLPSMEAEINCTLQSNSS